MNKYNSFKIKYELKNNANTTQNLFMKTYQGYSLISEIDLGDICDIVMKRKIKENLIKYIEDKIKKVRESTCDSKDLDDIKLFNYMSELMLSIYKDLLERIKSSKYE